MPDSMDRLSALRRTIARIERQRPAEAPAAIPFGHAAIDRALGGGLLRGRLHEIFAAEAGDESAAAGFAAMLARLAAPAGTALLWLREDCAESRGGRLHAPGLAELGIDPSAVILAVLPDAIGVLRAAAEVVRCPEVAVAVIELWGSARALDLTASRKLAVAAEASGVTALLLRAGAEPVPSAAQTRWAVAAAAAAPLEADAPGHPALAITLLRQKGGMTGGHWQLEWDRDDRAFRAPLSGAVLPLPARRPVAADAGAARRRRAG